MGIVNVFRFDPTRIDNGHYDRFEVKIADEKLTTILDVLLKIQSEKDPSLAFRYACRVSMCGAPAAWSSTAGNGWPVKPSWPN